MKKIPNILFAHALVLAVLVFAPSHARASATPQQASEQSGAAITGQKFFPLTKARSYNGRAISKPYILPKHTGMTAVGNGHYFPLPRRAGIEKSYDLPRAGQIGADETKPLPQAQAQHILSLFAPDEQVR